MPRQTRAERQRGQGGAPPPPEPARAGRGVEVTQAHCPLCFHARPIAWWETVLGAQDDTHPFGFRQVFAGRGRISEGESILPEQDPPLYRIVKQKFLRAITFWIRRGWLSQAEVAQAVRQGQER